MASKNLVFVQQSARLSASKGVEVLCACETSESQHDQTSAVVARTLFQVVEQAHRRLLATPGRATYFATLGELRRELLGSSTIPSTGRCIAALAPCFASHGSIPPPSRLGLGDRTQLTFRDSRWQPPVTSHCTPSGLPGLSLGRLPGRGADEPGKVQVRSSKGVWALYCQQHAVRNRLEW